MSDERLKEIKDSIDFQMFVVEKTDGYNKILANEELELYNEVIRLREENEKLLSILADIVNNFDDLKYIKGEQ